MNHLIVSASIILEYGTAGKKCKVVPEMIKHGVQ